MEQAPLQQLVKDVEELFSASEQTVIMAQRVSKSEASGAWNPLAFNKKLSTKPRILAITAKRSLQTQKFKVNIHVIKEDTNGKLSLSKTYKLKHLAKIEAVQTDPTGCSIILHFDNHKSGLPVPHWGTKSIDERNELLVCLVRMCRENGKKAPTFVGIDLVEVALWAQAHQVQLATGDAAAGQTSNLMVAMDSSGKGGLTKGQDPEMVTAKEEEDMEELLGTYVMGIDEADAFSERLKRELAALEAANVHAILESEPMVAQVLQKLDEAAHTVNDMDEWLKVFNLKLRHMREDIESIESRNNRLEMQAQNNAKLLSELERVSEKLRVPPEYASLLTGGPFEEPCMPQNLEACEWLSTALAGLNPPHLEAEYSQMRAVKEKRAELEQLNATFVSRAVGFLRNYLGHIADFMLQDKNHFSTRGALKAPNHSELRRRCRAYARLLHLLKDLDKKSLPVLRKAYCQSMNLLLRREAREFANELRASTKLPKAGNSSYLDATNNGLNSPGGAPPAAAAEAFSTMLRTIIPLIVDESTFLAFYMGFSVPLAGAAPTSLEDEDDLSPMALDGSDVEQQKTAPNPEELKELNASLLELFDGIQEDFQAVVDWACRSDALQSITLQGLTERWLESHGSDENLPFIKRLLVECQSRVRTHFMRFVEDNNHSIEKYDTNTKRTGVLPYIPRFAHLAGLMEGLIQGKARDMVDLAYNKLVGTMFAVMTRISQQDPKHADVLLLENYASFQNNLYELAAAVPALAAYYQQASDQYEQACTRYINSIINYQFGRLFQFAERIETLLYTLTAEEVSYQLGFSKVDMRKLIKTTLSSVERQIKDMYKRMQKHLSTEDLLPSLWEKCKEDFMEKYENMEALLAKCYSNEQLSPSSPEMRMLFNVV